MQAGSPGPPWISTSSRCAATTLATQADCNSRSGKPHDHAGRRFPLPRDVHVQGDETPAGAARDAGAVRVDERREDAAVETNADAPRREQLHAAAGAGQKAQLVRAV